MNDFEIKNAASSALNQIRRTSFSEDGFTSEQIEAISEAIASAIVAYDEQRNTDS